MTGLLRTRVATGTFLAAVTFVGAPVVPAGADATDAQFIDTLRSQGVPYLSEDNAIAVAAAVCAYVRAGQLPDQVAVDIVGPSGWNAQHSDAFVRAATRAYCPA